MEKGIIVGVNTNQANNEKFIIPNYDLTLCI